MSVPNDILRNGIEIKTMLSDRAGKVITVPVKVGLVGY